MFELILFLSLLLCAQHSGTKKFEDNCDVATIHSRESQRSTFDSLTSRGQLNLKNSNSNEKN